MKCCGIIHNMKPRLLKPMDELPRWAYIDSEWKDICWITVDIINGVRMVYDIAGQKRLEQQEQEAIKKAKLLKESPSLGLIL